MNVLNFSRLTGSLVLGLSLISHTSFAFIDASALSAIVPTVPVPKKPKDLSQASDYVAPADATDSTSSGSSASAPAAYKRKNSVTTRSGSRVLAATDPATEAFVTQEVQSAKQAIIENQDDQHDEVQDGFTQMADNQKKITTNQSSMTTNQVQLGTNQTTLSSNQKTMVDQNIEGNKNILEALSKLITPDQMRDLLNGSKCQDPNQCTSEDKDFLSLLEDLLGKQHSVPTTGAATASMQAMLAAIQSQPVSDAYAQGMVDIVNQTMSGAGNATGTDDFSVSNVISGVKDPIQSTNDDFNKAVFPIVAPVDNNPGEFTSAECTSVDSITTDQQKFLCNMLVNAMYASTLVKSCKDDWSTSNPSGTGSQSGVASSATSASTSSSTAPSFTKASYPDGVNGCTSEKYTDTTNQSWNGWNDTVTSLSGAGVSTSATGPGTNTTGIIPFCNGVVGSLSLIYNANDKQYEALAKQVQSNCQDLIDTLQNNTAYNYDSNFDGVGSSGQPLLIDVSGKIPAVVKSVQKLLTWQMYAHYSNPSISGLQQGYPSMWTLLGYDDLNSNEANSLYNTTNSDSSSDMATSSTGTSQTTNGQTLNDMVADCVDELSKDLSGSQVTVSYPAVTDAAKLAQLYIANISDQLPAITFLPIPSFASVVGEEAGAAAIFTANGRFYAFDSSGQALNSNTENATTVKIDTSTGIDINTVISNQSAATSAITAFATSYQDQMQRLLTQRLLSASALQQFYTDRTIKVSYSGTSKCSLTPAQIRRYNAMWRIDPTVQICATTTSSAQDCSQKGTWIEQIATSTSDELIPEINLLLSELVNQNYILNQQNQTLILLQSLASSGVIQEGITKLGNTAVGVKNMINSYNTGSSVASATPLPTG